MLAPHTNALAMLLVLWSLGCQPSPEAPDAARGDATSEAVRDAVSEERCAVPPGAPAYVREAAAGAGLRCHRYPFALRAPRDVIEARDGAVYVTEMSAGRVVRLRDDGVTTVADGLMAPIGLRELPDGRLLVAEENAHRVSRIDPRTGAGETLAGGLAQVTYLALGPDGAAYVSSFVALDAPTAAVKRVDADGGVSDFATGLNVPEGLFFDARGRLHVANWGAPSRLLRFDRAGGDATVVASGFTRLYGAAPAVDGVVVGDTAAGIVTLLRDDGTRATLLRDVAAPAGLFRTASGDLLVAELGLGDFTGTGYVIRLSPR